MKRSSFKRNQYDEPEFELSIPAPLGMKFSGAPNFGQFISSAQPGGNAEASGKIIPGLRIIAVGETSVLALTKKEVVALMKASTPLVQLRLAKDSKGLARYQAAKENGTLESGGGDPGSSSIEEDIPRSNSAKDAVAELSFPDSLAEAKASLQTLSTSPQKKGRPSVVNLIEDALSAVGHAPAAAKTGAMPRSPSVISARPFQPVAVRDEVQESFEDFMAAGRGT